ncbi:tRNA (adenosine(37)-N6)-threonylcarbamoyltransferase complex ATPase subunit type 1 TsaE [Mucilaginibacter sp. AW1-3]
MNQKLTDKHFQYQLENIQTIADKIIEAAGNQKIFLFHGEMGAGKTTLIKAICAALGTGENTSSPTFSIVNEYLIPKGKIYHFDFYRLKNQTEALDMGYEEYFYSGEYCFIEWPEKIADLLPEHYLDINIEILADNKREIHISNI